VSSSELFLFITGCCHDEQFVIDMRKLVGHLISLTIFCVCLMLKVKRLKVVYSCLWGTRHRAMERHLPYGITHLAQVYMPLFNPSQTDRYSISYLGGIEC